MKGLDKTLLTKEGKLFRSKEKYYFKKVVDFLKDEDCKILFFKIAVVVKGGMESPLEGLCETDKNGRQLLVINPTSDIINTLIHESLHAVYPEKEEAEVYCLADEITNQISHSQVIKLLSLAIKRGSNQ